MTIVTSSLFWINIISLVPVSSDHEINNYNYPIRMKRKYLSMKFNSFIQVDGDPTERDITVTWLRNITKSIDVEVLYIVQTPEGNQITSKSFELPTLCTGSQSSNDWDRNIINICLQGVTNKLACPIEPVTITPQYSFDTTITLSHKLVWKTLYFILDLYPVDQLDSFAMIVWEGHVHPSP